MRQSHLIRITIIGALLAAVAFAGIRLDGQAARALTNCSVSDISLDGEEQAFLTLVNNYRAQNGLGALSLSTNLNRASHWLGGDMGAKRYFSHTDSLGRSPSQRAIDCGYPQGAGENIAAGTVWDTAAEVFQAWRNSSGHNANMLNSSYRQIGIARVFVSGSPYGYYWVTDFGQTNDGTNGSGSGGSAATATPSPTPPPATTSGPASVALPASGSTLSGSSASFSWLAASGALEYFFYAGLSTGDNSLYAASTGTNRSVAVSNLPVDGRTIYVRLWTRFSNGWQYSDTTYRAATQSVATTSTKAVLTSPSAGSTLPSGTVTFRWTAATGALQYYFYLGTSQGSNSIFSRSFTASSTSLAMTGLPEDGRTLWVRLWTRSNSGWQYNDYWFRAAP